MVYGRTLLHQTLLSLLALIFIGCVSPEEQKERQDDAFNLQGSYEPTFQQDLNVEFKIINQGHRSNIKAELVRTGELTEGEKKALEKYQIPVEKIQDFFLNKTVDFARGSDSDNESVDNGKTSSFYICSPSVSHQADFADPDKKGIVWHKSSTYYCLSGTAQKSDGKISGKLSMMIRLTGTGPGAENGKRETHYKSAEAPSFNYTTDMKGGFSSQYVGEWQGTIYNTTDPSLSQIVGLKFSSADGGAHFLPSLLFRVVHVDGSRIEELKAVPYKAVDYTLEDLPVFPEDLETKKFPQILFSFQAASGARLIFSGTIWSLGSYKGTIVHVEKDQETLVGSFEFIKR